MHGAVCRASVISLHFLILMVCRDLRKDEQCKDWYFKKETDGFVVSSEFLND